MSACHSGSATPTSRGASTATSIRSRCPALLHLPSAVATNARFSRGSWDKRAAVPRGFGVAPACLDAAVKVVHYQAARMARGEAGYPALRGKAVGNLIGMPVGDKVLRYWPNEDAGHLTAAALFIVAENEELFQTRQMRSAPTSAR